MGIGGTYPTNNLLWLDKNVNIGENIDYQKK